MELDASCMNGDNRAVGAVAAVKNFLPIRIARRLMDKGPHTLLVGAGAERFARDCGLSPEPTLAPAQYEKWEQHIKPLLEDHGFASLMDLVARSATPPLGAFDTVVMVASDGQGLSCASSTSGWPRKHPGRLGDTPVPGAGFASAGAGAPILAKWLCGQERPDTSWLSSSVEKPFTMLLKMQLRI
jgi:N4-(beta-N-acetylglucosaminyl)-L-asparaginase